VPVWDIRGTRKTSRLNSFQSRHLEQFVPVHNSKMATISVLWKLIQFKIKSWPAVCSVMIGFAPMYRSSESPRALWTVSFWEFQLFVWIEDNQREIWSLSLMSILVVVSPIKSSPIPTVNGDEDKIRHILFIFFGTGKQSFLLRTSCYVI
jgi:hypothetical protein